MKINIIIDLDEQCDDIKLLIEDIIKQEIKYCLKRNEDYKAYIAEKTQDAVDKLIKG